MRVTAVDAASPTPKRILICVHTRLTAAKPSCGGRGGLRIAEMLEREIAEQRLDIAVERFKCFGRCEEGPNARLAPGGEFHCGLTPEQVPAVLAAARRFIAGNLL